MKKKGLLISPPQWIPTAPHLAVPLLVGVLRKNGFETDGLDLSVRFYNEFLSAENLTAVAEKIKQIAGDDAYGLDICDPRGKETALQRRKTILDFLKKNDFDPGSFVVQTVDAVDTLKSESLFYDPVLLFDAKNRLSHALNVASLPFFPARLAFDNYYGNDLYGYSWDALRVQAQSPEDNMFFGFMTETARHISEDDYTWVGLSVADLSQLLAAVTLGRFIKRFSPDTQVLFGGNYLTQIRADIENCPDFFDFCCDAVSFGDGENVFPLLIGRIVSGQTLDGLPETAFLKDGHVVVGGADHKGFELESTAYPCFDNYDFSLYIAPEPVFPIQFSKGCYWGKCAFCDYFNGEPCFFVKSVLRAADELQYYVDTYHARAFFIVDEALPPVFFEAFADEIIRRDINIGCYAFARLESGFTVEVLSKLHAAGVKLLMWGYEAASPRVMRLLGKGIDIDNRLTILRSSADAGIWNNGLFIIGSPTETVDEAYATLEIIKNNEELFHSVTLANFNLTRNSVMMREPEKYGIAAVRQSAFLKKIYDEAEGMSVRERLRLRAEFDRTVIELRRGRPWNAVYSDFDHLLLYLIRYGRSVTDGLRLPSGDHDE